MKTTVPPVSIAGSQIGEIRHVCAFFNSDEEEYRVLLPFIQDGFRNGDKAVHIVNPESRLRHLERLGEAQIDVDTASQTGQLEIRSNTETYLNDGVFDQDRMLRAFEEMASGNAKGKFPLSRIVCRMDWAGASQEHVRNLVEFEARVNRVWQQHDDAVICSYHLSKFGGEAVIDILRTHPMIIIGGVIHQNPFYLPPEDFLNEFRNRREGPIQPKRSGA